MQIITCNDDFNTKRSNVPALSKRTPAPLFIGIQEGKIERYRDMLDPKLWLVRQGTGSDARKGNAVIIRRDLATKVGSRADDPSKRGWGIKILTKRDRGDQMLDRYITWADVRLKSNGKVIRLAACHRPPQRERDNWAEFDRNLSAWAKASPVPVIVAMDANQPNPKFTGLVWTGLGIDGFAHSKSITLNNRSRLPKDSSDHHPVLARFKP